MLFTQNALSDVPNGNHTVEQIGRTYFIRLLKNIKIMLNYTEENGIVIPDDLTEKISALFVGSAGSLISTAAASDKPLDKKP